MSTVYESQLTSLPLVHRGKVRDNYAVGNDKLLMLASDRISAFDVVMGQPIPGKGVLLTTMALFWFDKLAHIVPNHLTGEDPQSVVAPAERGQVQGRSMLVKRLQPLPIEAVVRGYLAGSGWKEYQVSGTVCGVPLPAGLHAGSRLPTPIFTPATKAPAGEHDENIDYATCESLIGVARAAEVRQVSLRLYQAAADHAQARGIVIADTKFEFGLDGDGRLTVMDEMLTPDSSRFWRAAVLGRSAPPGSYDKQRLRDWLEQAAPSGVPWNKLAPAPTLPTALVEEIRAGYERALQTLT